MTTPSLYSARRRRRLVTPLLAVAALGAVACGPAVLDANGHDEQSGTDARRTGAIEMPVGRTIIDHVDKFGGDMHDWKYFTLNGTGFVEFTIAFDELAAKGTAIVRDAMGQQVTRLEHAGEPRLQTTFRAQPGVYYVEVFSNANGSSYTLEVDFIP